MIYSLVEQFLQVILSDSFFFNFLAMKVKDFTGDVSAERLLTLL